ncbi:MAG: bifunctional alpha,alpha-trehalose-phosphate synthase (UDP-forming)/trehalose-phosphatase [Vicinamibacterales bacterium]
MADSRLLIVSNRLPVAARLAAGRVRLALSSGGLAAGLRPYHADGARGVWIGWPGDVSRWPAEERRELDARLRQRAIVPVHLSPEHVERYYHGFANRVLWPLFHYLIDRMPVHATGWDAYKAVNEAFADVVAREYRPGDTIWVHDYQLMLVPALLRERLPGARIGFFLHIPFPSSEVFRILPWRSQILHGLLGADLVGFHAFAYMRHLMASLLHVEGVEPDIDRVRVGDRDVLLGVFPMGVDAARFTELSQDPAVIARAAAIKQEAGGRQILLGVDRLDYTKGIPRRLQAVERLLEREPDLIDRIRYIQVAVPSRGEVDSYQRFKREVEEAVGRINGARGSLRSTPVHYMHRSVAPRELVALYRAADAMLVTPLRDGMNLVAKEFVASRSDDDGVLVLSEFAGAAAELDGAVIVNPYDVDGVADVLTHALFMSAGERRARMQSLRRQVLAYDVHAWAAAFLDRLQAARPAVSPSEEPAPRPTLRAVLTDARHAPGLRLLLDYDGTLTPIVRDPQLAAPDEELLGLLRTLAAIPEVRLDIVSGRPRETLEGWLGDLPIGLWAEHGFWRRAAPGDPWEPASLIPPDWMNRTRPILEQFTARTPGSHLEQKTASIAWHYRRAQREFGARQAHELRMLLGEALSNQPFEVLEGKKVIEVRLRGVSKAVVARRVQAETGDDTVIVAIGDDRTDEDLFRALRPSAITIAVGTLPTGARFRVDNVQAVREILRLLASTAADRRGPPRVPSLKRT